MKITETSLPDVLLVNSNVYKDNRGLFFESFNLRAMTEAGLPSTWAQDNFSESKKNVLRGIHYQVIQPQGKLVWVAYGTVLDIAVDLRKSSPHFGRHVAVEISGGTGDMLWIPPGFGHAFLVLSEAAGRVERSRSGDFMADRRRRCDCLAERRRRSGSARRGSL